MGTKPPEELPTINSCWCLTRSNEGTSQELAKSFRKPAFVALSKSVEAAGISCIGSSAYWKIVEVLKLFRQYLINTTSVFDTAKDFIRSLLVADLGIQLAEKTSRTHLLSMLKTG